MQAGRTIITTIHQPSSRMFYMFDKLLLISEGKPIFYGKARDSMKYFSSIGFVPQLAMNPAEFLLDLATGHLNDIAIPQESQQLDMTLIKVDHIHIHIHMHVELLTLIVVENILMNYRCFLGFSF